MSNARKVLAGLRDAIDWVKGDRSKARVVQVDPDRHTAMTDTEMEKRHARYIVISKLLDLGFRSPKIFGEDHWAAIIQKGSFFAIVDGDKDALAVGFINRWHYGTVARAQQSLEGWDGTGEPRGWFSKEIAVGDAMTIWP